MFEKKKRKKGEKKERGSFARVYSYTIQVEAFHDEAMRNPSFQPPIL